MRQLMSYRTIADAELDERIRKLELAISRIGNVYIKQATQQRLDRLYRERATRQKS